MSRKRQRPTSIGVPQEPATEVRFDGPDLVAGAPPVIENVMQPPITTRVPDVRTPEQGQQVYVRRNPPPRACPRCGVTILPGGKQAVIVRTTSVDRAFAYLACRGCGHGFRLPIAMP